MPPQHWYLIRVENMTVIAECSSTPVTMKFFCRLFTSKIVKTVKTGNFQRSSCCLHADLTHCTITLWRTLADIRRGLVSSFNALGEIHSSVVSLLQERSGFFISLFQSAFLAFPWSNYSNQINNEVQCICQLYSCFKRRIK